MESVDRAQLVSREGNNSVLLRIGTDSMIVKAESIIGKVAQWLTSEGHKSGLMMRGNVGVGKTTLLNALKSVIDVFDGDGRKLRVVRRYSSLKSRLTNVSSSGLHSSQ